jgi:hypothetical protein
MLCHWVSGSQCSKGLCVFVFKGKGVQEKLWTAQPLKMRPSRCLEISGTNHPVTRCHIAEEQKSALRVCESLKTHTECMLTVVVVTGNRRFTIIGVTQSHPGPRTAA